MSRNFPDFVDAYMKYANDGFVPEHFNKWSCLATIASALERKVWLPWTDTFSYYPNIYVLMVSLPGVGKSTALNKAVGLLTDMNLKTTSMNIIPSQVTEAKFIKLMGNAKPFQHGTRSILQSSGFYWASEASNSLKNIYGDFIACLTDFYDCPPLWEKATNKDDKITLRNVCLNLLAGSTFDYLSKLVTDDNIMGGFASRLIYVVHREKLIRNQKFQLGGGGSDPSGARAEYRKALVEDLTEIHKMVGPFTATKEFGEAWEEWYPDFEEKRQSNPSEKMQSLLVRTNTNVIKTAMLFSAAERSDRVLTIEHWDKALTLVETIEKDLPGIFRESKAGDVQSQSGLMQAIFKIFVNAPNRTLSASDLRGALYMQNAHPIQVDATVKALMNSGKLKIVGADSSGSVIKLLADPDHYI